MTLSRSQWFASLPWLHAAPLAHAAPLPRGAGPAAQCFISLSMPTSPPGGSEPAAQPPGQPLVEDGGHAVPAREVRERHQEQVVSLSHHCLDTEPVLTQCCAHLSLIPLLPHSPEHSVAGVIIARNTVPVLVRGLTHLSLLLLPTGKGILRAAAPKTHRASCASTRSSRCSVMGKRARRARPPSRPPDSGTARCWPPSQTCLPCRSASWRTPSGGLQGSAARRTTVEAARLG